MSAVYDLEVSRHFEAYENWCNSKIFVHSADFSCMIFLAQNVPIPTDKILSKPLDHNVLILFVSNTYNGNILAFWARKLCMKTWYSSKIFMNLSIFLVWFFSPKLSQYLQSIYYYCDHQNWQAGYIQWVTFFQKFTKSLDHVVSWCYKKS